jgi:HSP20 family protein
MKSMIPVGSERGLSRSLSNPFTALQQEIDRLFDGFSRGLPASQTCQPHAN